MATSTKQSKADLTMEDRYHAEGCPALTGELDREANPLEARLETRKQDGKELRIVRCVECGGQFEEVLS